MADLNFITFSPSTTAKSSEVNSNFSDIQTRENAKKPTLYLQISGVVDTTSSAFPPIPVSQSLIFSAIRLSVGTAPTGAALIVDVKKNGTTIFSTKPQVAAGDTSGGSAAVFSVSGVVDGDLLTCAIDQVGSTVPGSDLTISLIFSY